MRLFGVLVHQRQVAPPGHRYSSGAAIASGEKLGHGPEGEEPAVVSDVRPRIAHAEDDPVSKRGDGWRGYPGDRLSRINFPQRREGGRIGHREGHTAGKNVVGVPRDDEGPVGSRREGINMGRSRARFGHR